MGQEARGLVETYSRIGLLRGYGNLQSYWTTTTLWKLTVVLDYYNAMETYSRNLVTPGLTWMLPPPMFPIPPVPLNMMVFPPPPPPPDHLQFGRNYTPNEWRR